MAARDIWRKTRKQYSAEEKMRTFWPATCKSVFHLVAMVATQIF